MEVLLSRFDSRSEPQVLCPTLKQLYSHKKLSEKIDARFSASRVILLRGIEIAKRKKRKIERGGAPDQTSRANYLW
jgi:hypothetical protein